jgi:hypothetical protein
VHYIIFKERKGKGGKQNRQFNLSEPTLGVLNACVVGLLFQPQVHSITRTVEYWNFNARFEENKLER